MATQVVKAQAALTKASLIVLLDDTGPEQSGYLLSAASSIDAQQIAFMANHGRGVVLAAIDEARCKELCLSPVSPVGPGGFEFTLSVEARAGISTGVSAPDRAATLRTLAETESPRSDLITPGHIFPVQARSGGVLVRASVAEAAVDLMKRIKAPPVAALCQCLDENGRPLTLSGAGELAKRHSLAAVSLSDVICERLASETIVDRVSEAKLPIRGIDEFRSLCYRSRIDGAEHLVLVKGDLDRRGTDGLQQPIITRVQAEERLGDLLDLQPAAGRTRLGAALAKISERGRGVFVYIRHPRKGLLAKQIQSMQGGVKPPSTKAVQLREYGVGAQILKDLGAQRLVLLTNSEREIPGIDAFELEITGRERLT